MKCSSDFVTNSSSSSFIIGKKDDISVTVNFVYQLVRDLYLDLIKNRDALIKYIEDYPDLGLEYIKSTYGNYYYFKFKNDKKENWERNRLIRKQIEKDFGINDYDCFSEKYDWLKCKTYDEYEKYWLNDKTNNCAPFTIADFTESKEINLLHLGKYKGEISKELHNISYTSDVVGWYYNWIEEAFDYATCEECCNHEWCDKIDKEECNETKLTIKGMEIPKEKACLYLLGRVCVYSECGCIPDYVVKRLGEVSEYWCNHMG